MYCRIASKSIKWITLNAVPLSAIGLCGMMSYNVGKGAGFSQADTIFMNLKQKMQHQKPPRPDERHFRSFRHKRGFRLLLTEIQHLLIILIKDFIITGGLNFAGGTNNFQDSSWHLCIQYILNETYRIEKSWNNQIFDDIEVMQNCNRTRINQGMTEKVWFLQLNSKHLKRFWYIPKIAAGTGTTKNSNTVDLGFLRMHQVTTAAAALDAPDEAIVSNSVRLEKMEDIQLKNLE